ncbi:MAG: hypothetical protein V3S39_04680 [Thermodesulfobacteriota bacterium]
MAISKWVARGLTVPRGIARWQRIAKGGDFPDALSIFTPWLIHSRNIH